MDSEKYKQIQIETEKRLAAMKKGTHRHYCDNCPAIWEHTGDDIKNRHKAHCCPNCGEYVIALFLNASPLPVVFWDGTEENPKVKIKELKRRDEFEQAKIRRIERRIYWLLKKLN